MYFLCVVLVMVSFYDDDYSLAGLTQEGHEVEIQDISSDDEPLDPESNFRLLLEGARALSSSESQISNFNDKIFQFSHGDSVDMVSHSLSQIKRPQNASLMASLMASQESDVHVSFSFLSCF